MNEPEFQGMMIAKVDAVAGAVERLERGQERIFSTLDAREEHCHATHLALEQRLPRPGNGARPTPPPTPPPESDPAPRPRMNGKARAAIQISIGAGAVLALLEGLPRLISAIKTVMAHQ